MVPLPSTTKSRMPFGPKVWGKKKGKDNFGSLPFASLGVGDDTFLVGGRVVLRVSEADGRGRAFGFSRRASRKNKRKVNCGGSGRSRERLGCRLRKRIV